MIEYQQRDETLRTMGFGSYAAYLDSRLWRRIRHRVLKRRGACVCCGEPAKEVHHKDYAIATMKGESLLGLVSMCATCHDLAEFDSDGSKATLNSANQKIDMLASLDRTEAKAMPERPWLAFKADSRETKRPSKRKLILARIPPELLPANEKGPKKPKPLSRSRRMMMFPLPKE